MGRLLNANEPVIDDGVKGHGQYLNANEPVAEDDVEGHGVWQNANEPVAEDDVEGHIWVTSINAALTVSGGFTVPAGQS